MSDKELIKFIIELEDVLQLDNHRGLTLMAHVNDYAKLKEKYIGFEAMKKIGKVLYKKDAKEGE